MQCFTKKNFKVVKRFAFAKHYFSRDYKLLEILSCKIYRLITDLLGTEADQTEQQISQLNSPNLLSPTILP